MNSVHAQHYVTQKEYNAIYNVIQHNFGDQSQTFFKVKLKHESADLWKFTPKIWNCCTTEICNDIYNY